MKYLPIIITALLLLAACSTEIKEEPKLAEQLKEQITTETPQPQHKQEQKCTDSLMNSQK